MKHSQALLFLFVFDDLFEAGRACPYTFRESGQVQRGEEGVHNGSTLAGDI
jgi:hypothetical protein